jgi:uncharacterized protein (DUF952 family)
MAKPEKHIFHIFEKARWADAQARGEYTPEGFEKEGFIHLSSKHQLKGTAERYYRGQTGLGVLKVEISRLKAPLKYENLMGGDELFPHLYGPLNTDAVAQIVFLGLTHEGEFLWPDELF